jgi:hypothetical protein
MKRKGPLYALLGPYPVIGLGVSALALWVLLRGSKPEAPPRV